MKDQKSCFSSPAGHLTCTTARGRRRAVLMLAANTWTVGFLLPGFGYLDTALYCLLPTDLLEPEGCLDGVLELEVAGLAVVGDGHHVHVRVIELDPGELVTVGREPEGPGVGQHLLLTSVSPVSCVTDVIKLALGVFKQNKLHIQGKVPSLCLMPHLVHPVGHTVEHNSGSPRGAHLKYHTYFGFSSS